VGLMPNVDPDAGAQATVAVPLRSLIDAE